MPQAILLDLGASADLDIGTSDMLRDLCSDLRARQIDLLFAQIRGSVRDRMVKTGLLEYLGEDQLYASVDAAVHSFLTLVAAKPLPTGAAESNTLDGEAKPA
jgi:MFS superfamily sulfate permease-like transporter